MVLGLDQVLERGETDHLAVFYSDPIIFFSGKRNLSAFKVAEEKSWLIAARYEVAEKEEIIQRRIYCGRKATGESEIAETIDFILGDFPEFCEPGVDKDSRNRDLILTLFPTHRL